ncbi:MAG: hypothetical protein ACREUO_02175 [Burkholderiales bacterium]
MKPTRLAIAAAIAAALSAAAQAQTTPPPAPTTETKSSETRYVQRIDARFQSFAGSSANLESLALGLRRGTEVTLAGSGETATFAPPTRPMGYGNVTRALDLASRQLAAAGIADPSPLEIKASLMGGTVNAPTGDVTLDGVLQLRSEGMGWGRIAHTIGVHPGLGSGKSTPAPAAGVSGITTASGAQVAHPGAGKASSTGLARGKGHGGAITTAAGATPSSGATASGASKGQGIGHARGKN